MAVAQTDFLVMVLAPATKDSREQLAKVVSLIISAPTAKPALLPMEKPAAVEAAVRTDSPVMANAPVVIPAGLEPPVMHAPPVTMDLLAPPALAVAL